MIIILRKWIELLSKQESKKQGKNRFDRGTNFFNDLTRLGVERNLPFRWRYQLVPTGIQACNELNLAVSEFLLKIFKKYFFNKCFRHEKFYFPLNIHLIQRSNH